VISFHLPKLLDKHFLRYCRDRPFEVGEAQHFAAEEMKKDDELPAALQNFERILDTLSGADRCLRLTFRCVPYFFVRSCHFIILV
jgi:hypothetical protein